MSVAHDPGLGPAGDGEPAGAPAVSASPAEPREATPGPRVSSSRFRRDVDYYAAGMQPRWTGLLGRILALVLRPVRLASADAARVQALAKSGVVVYVSRTCSALDYLTYNKVFVEHGLPLSRFANSLNLMWLQPVRELAKTLVAKVRYLVRGRRMPPPHVSGFLEDLTLSGESSLLFLFRPDGWLERWLRPMWYPMETILRAQRALDRPVYLVPVMVLHEKSAPSLRRSLFGALVGRREEPGPIWRLVSLLRHRKRAIVRIGEHLDLREFLARDLARDPAAGDPAAGDAEAARKLRWVLRNYLFREQRMVQGPPHKPRATVIDRVLRRMGPDLEAHAARGQRDLGKVRAEARTCIDEMASNPDRTWVDLWKSVFHWAIGRLYEPVDGLTGDEIAALKRKIVRSPIVVIPNHRSHIDYQLVLDYLDDLDIVPPLTAAGINLAFWPMGPIARRCHAFFIRRTFKGSAVYPLAFRHYLAYMLRDGYPVMFFIEGTRSRTGKVLPPKLGMLTMIAETFLETASFDDLTIVPLAIGYDRVIEEASLVRELSGEPKQPESLVGLLQIPRLLQRRYGRLSIRMGEMISLKEYFAASKTPGDGAPEASYRRALGRLGQRVVHQLSRAQAVHASAILAMVLLARREGIVTQGELLRGADRLLEYLVFAGVPLEAALKVPDRALADAISLFQTGGLVRVERTPDPWGRIDPWSGVLSVDPQRRATLDYYRNNALHHVAPLATLSMSLVAGGDAGEWSHVERDYSFLRELLAAEFQHDPDAPWKDSLERAAEFLERKRLLERAGATYLVPARAHRTLELYAHAVAPSLESYRTALRFLALLERGGQRPANQVLSLVQYASLELRRGQLGWPESISTEQYKNALAFFKAHADRGFEHFAERIDALVAPVKAGA